MLRTAMPCLRHVKEIVLPWAKSGPEQAPSIAKASSRVMGSVATHRSAKLTASFLVESPNRRMTSPHASSSTSMFVRVMLMCMRMHHARASTRRHWIGNAGRAREFPEDSGLGARFGP